MEFRHQTLDNGLEIVAECNPQAYSSAMAFFVKTGARDENDALSGVSHFLEHMVFKGTPTRSAEDVNRELDELGSHSNAFTSEEQTVYYITVLPEYQQRALHLLSDIMRPSLRESDFEMEKKVILEEIAKYEDQPPFGAYEKAMALHFGTHPLSRSVLGTTSSVAALTPQQMRAYFRHRYSPGNMALVAAGNMDFDQLVASAKQYCGAWEPFATYRQTPRAEPCTDRRVVHNEIATQEYVLQIANGPAADDPDRYAARLLSTIVADDSGSRIFWELVDTGRAECASMGNYEYEGTGILLTFLACAPEQTVENLDIIERLEQQVEADGVTEKELEIAKNKICAHIVLQSERPQNRMFSVGNNWVQRRQYRTLKEVVESYRGVTLDDVAAVIQKYPLTQCSTMAVGPLAKIW